MAMVAACVSAHVPEMSGGRGALFRHSPADAPSRPIILDWSDRCNAGRVAQRL